MTAGFPNIFFITGPQSPNVLTNVIVAIEQHVDWIAECLKHMRASGKNRIGADLAHEDQWLENVGEVASGTLFPKANCWYVGADIPGKPRVFAIYVGGFGTYRQKCLEIAAND